MGAGPSKVISSPKDILLRWRWLMRHTKWHYVKFYFSSYVFISDQCTFALHYFVYSCMFTSQRKTDYQQHVSCIWSYYHDWYTLQYLFTSITLLPIGNISYFLIWDDVDCFGKNHFLPFILIKTIWNRNWMILQMTAMQCWSYGVKIWVSVCASL